jgi:hypothetical protein
MNKKELRMLQICLMMLLVVGQTIQQATSVIISSDNKNGTLNDEFSKLFLNNNNNNNKNINRQNGRAYYEHYNNNNNNNYFNNNNNNNNNNFQYISSPFFAAGAPSSSSSSLSSSSSYDDFSSERIIIFKIGDSVQLENTSSSYVQLFDQSSINYCNFDSNLLSSKRKNFLKPRTPKPNFYVNTFLKGDSFNESSRITVRVQFQNRVANSAQLWYLIEAKSICTDQVVGQWKLTRESSMDTIFCFDRDDVMT